MSPKSPVKDVQEALFSEVKNVQETLFSGGQGESPPKREMIVELSGGGAGDTLELRQSGRKIKRTTRIVGSKRLTGASG